MPFGLTNAPAVFQALVNDVLWDMLNRFMFVYIDDMLIFSKSVEEHVQHVHAVLLQLLKHALFVKSEKCELHASASFLVYEISLGNIQMDPTQANHRWTPALVYRIGQKVWFSTQHLPLWESKKLTPRSVSPFSIQRVISLVAVRLQAPEIHAGPPHVSKVKPSGPACPPSVCPCLA